MTLDIGFYKKIAWAPKPALQAKLQASPSGSKEVFADSPQRRALEERMSGCFGEMEGPTASHFELEGIRA